MSGLNSELVLDLRMVESAMDFVNGLFRQQQATIKKLEDRVKEQSDLIKRLNLKIGSLE